MAGFGWRYTSMVSSIDCCQLVLKGLGQHLLLHDDHTRNTYTHMRQPFVDVCVAITSELQEANRIKVHTQHTCSPLCTIKWSTSSNACCIHAGLLPVL